MPLVTCFHCSAERAADPILAWQTNIHLFSFSVCNGSNANFLIRARVLQWRVQTRGWKRGRLDRR